jgi:hypothetical protein
MLLALLAGQATPEEIAKLARGTAQRKIPQLINALEGHRMNTFLSRRSYAVYTKISQMTVRFEWTRARIARIL